MVHAVPTAFSMHLPPQEDGSGETTGGACQSVKLAPAYWLLLLPSRLGAAGRTTPEGLASPIHVPCTLYDLKAALSSDDLVEEGIK